MNKYQNNKTINDISSVYPNAFIKLLKMTDIEYEQLINSLFESRLKNKETAGEKVISPYVEVLTF